MLLKRKNCISLPSTPFSALHHHAHFQTKNSYVSSFFSNILVYNCRPNTYLPNPTNGFIVTAHAQLIFEKKCWFLALGGLVANFRVCPPPPRDPNMSTNISRQFTQHIKVASWVKGGNRVSKAKNAEKKNLSVYEKEDF